MLVCGSACTQQLKTVEHRQKEARQELGALGKPMLVQAVAEVGYMMVASKTASKTTEGMENFNWVAVDLRRSSSIDQIALIPVQMDWQIYENPNYRFPRLFKIQISEAADFSDATSIADTSMTGFTAPGITPMVFPVNGKSARYVRLSVHGAETFALAELMVLKGNRNLADGGEVSSSSNQGGFYPPRWRNENLVDGWTPLGPPVIVDESMGSPDKLYDGMFAGPNPDGSSVWMQLDLGQEFQIDEVRLHAVHPRTGLDIPGYRFPGNFKIESAIDPDFKTAQMVSLQSRYPNPRNQMATFQALHPQRARYVRITLIPDDKPGTQARMAFSEIQVYSGDRNEARSAVITSSGDPYEKRKHWPKNLLVDGYSSFGRIVELPEWLRNWTRRKELTIELEQLDALQVKLLADAARRQWILSGVMGTLFLAIIVSGIARMRQLRARDQEAFRKQLAHDLHDEIGSNLAAIGIMSEAVSRLAPPAASNHCNRISEIVKETTEAMRETLWLAGFKDKIGINLMELLRGTAARLLPGKSVEWTSSVELIPTGLPMEDRRQILLFFKEALANIVRHSDANHVTLSARIESETFILEVKDDGCGFQLETWSGSVGLESLQSRAKRLGGTVQIDTVPENGTRVILRTKFKS